MRSLLEPVQKSAFPTSPDKNSSGHKMSVNRSWIHFDQFLQQELRKRNKQNKEDEQNKDDMVFVEQTLERLLQKADTIHELASDKKMQHRLLEFRPALQQKSGNLLAPSLTPVPIPNSEFRVDFSRSYLQTQQFFSDPGGTHFTGTL